MPLKSQAHRAFLHANKPGLAKEFEAKTKKGKLPGKASTQKAKNSASTDTKKIRAPKRDRNRSY